MLEMHGSEAQISPGGHATRPHLPPETCKFFRSLPTPKPLLPYLERIENPALCYRKESPRAVVKGWKQFYTITKIKVF